MQSNAISASQAVSYFPLPFFASGAPAILSVTRPQAIMLTIRMNRAKGVHVAYRMSDVINELIDDHGCERAEIAAGIGATLDEIDILYADSIFKSRNLADYKYSKAWVPVEVRRAKAG